MDRHAATCAECGALLADLRKLRVDAANLPELAPGRDLWAGIEQRIETQVISISGTHEAARLPRPSRRWARNALLAASLAGAAVLGYALAPGRTVVVQSRVAAGRVDTVIQNVATIPETVTVASATPASRDSVAGPAATPVATVATVANTGVDRAYRTLVADYDREITKLRLLIEQRRNQMDPATVAVIERNLQVIDAAIAECKKAIARDPSSRFLIESLNQSLQAKVELMRTAALLPSRT
jgi:hypothetical protein